MQTFDESGPLRLGRFTLLRREARLMLDDRIVDMGPRSFDLLMVLATRPGRLFSKDELLERVWPGQQVEEGNIAVQVWALRKVLGSDIISTVPGRGYRLTIPVDTSAPAAAGTQADLHAGLASPARALPVGLLTRLPYVLAPMLGREDDLQALAAMVERHRLVSVIGPGGVGKTLLVQHLLDAKRHDYRHGVCWVELATLVDPAAIPDTIVVALGVQPGGGDSSQGLASAVAPLQMLIALDNAEHLLEPVAEVVRILLGAAPGVRLIVTSQAPLRASGEHCHRLGSLDVPIGPVSAQEALGFGAVSLFVERARAADSRFLLTPANVAAVVEVCRRLDGLPLAIELAATRAPALGMNRLAASMNDRLALLTAGRRASVPERQRTLRATLDWSHSLLDPVEQAVFRRMAVVAGSASLDFIQAVAADSPGGEISRLEVVDALCVLVDRSLVAVIDVPGHASPRYGLLESPRAYAFEQLTDSGELDRTRRQHANACVRSVEELEEALERGRVGREEWRTLLAPDLANARDAMAYAQSTGESDGAVAIGMALLIALPKSMFTDRMAIGEMIAGLLESKVSDRIRLRGWIELAKLWNNTSRQALARAMWKRALEDARRLAPTAENQRLLYAALAGSVLAVASTGDLTGATSLFDELRLMEEPTWPPQRLVLGVQAAKYLANAKGDAGTRLQLARKMYTLMVAAGMDASLGRLNVINAEIFAGQIAAAVHSASQLVAALETGRDEFILCFARNALVTASLASRDVARARDIAPSGWAAAMRFDLMAKWIDLLSHLCALEDRPRSAALLLGFSQAQWQSELRDPEEASQLDAVCRLVRLALPESEFTALQQHGADLRVEDVAGIAFGLEDTSA